MKILLTGPPKAGKSTITKEMAEESDVAFWVAAVESLDQDGLRRGFIAENSNGKKAIIADKISINSSVTLGSYKIDPNAINEVYVKPLNKVLADQLDGWIILDEIGRMQIKSPEFMEMVQHTFSANNDLLATIRFEDEWSKEFIDRKDVITFVITVENRNDIKRLLWACFKARKIYNSLSTEQRECVCMLANNYLEHDQSIQMGKLFNNAIPYIVDSRVEKRSESMFTVEGVHSKHLVSKEQDVWFCDCDLFNGDGIYLNNAGTCSHIMASQLSQV